MPFSLPSESSPANDDWALSAYDYHLPPEQIAQNPAVPRDSSRLLVVGAAPAYDHRIFRNLPDLLRPGDLLVMNNTRVLPARLYGHKVGGALVEVLLLEEQSPDQWLALVKPGRRLKPGARIRFSKLGAEPTASETSATSVAHETGAEQTSGIQGLEATIVAVDPATSGRVLKFELPPDCSLLASIHELGEVPLPPYITQSTVDPEQYQTVYGDRPGSAAAPTAGLHFTPELLEHLNSKGIEQAYITLHVGVGTFRPVEVENITTHKMHGEWLEISPETVEKINVTKRNGGRVIAVGTTVTRALESAAQTGIIQPFSGKSSLFIYPGYCWQVVDGLITNFHLPKSSLMMLVSALIGRDRLLSLYAEAIAQDYRFYSFGDAMLILPEAATAQPSQ